MIFSLIYLFFISFACLFFSFLYNIDSLSLNYIWNVHHVFFFLAIHNYKEEGPYRINLTVGESVHILQENGEWFFGYSTKNKSVRGIFPKCYIHFKECKVDRSGYV